VASGFTGHGRRSITALGSLILLSVQTIVPEQFHAAKQPSWPENSMRQHSIWRKQDGKVPMPANRMVYLLLPACFNAKHSSLFNGKRWAERYTINSTYYFLNKGSRGLHAGIQLLWW